jgi:CDGSH-type Zn-finger protein
MEDRHNPNPAPNANVTPHAIEVEAGKDYWWCACGRSKTQPFCDGSHKGSHFSPIKYTADANRIVWFCGCKQSRNKPFCDGRHKSIKT